MAVCHHFLKNFDKCQERATHSLSLKPTIKGFYRRASAFGAKKNYNAACEDLIAAIKLDTTDPNDLQTELAKFKRL